MTDKSWTSKVFQRLRNFQGSNNYPSSLAGKYKVTSVRDLTTGYDDSTPDNKALLPTDPNSEMITFGFENGVVMTLRNSGTEPKLKYYLEYCGQPKQTNWSSIEEELNEMVKAMSVEFIEI